MEFGQIDVLLRGGDDRHPVPHPIGHPVHPTHHPVSDGEAGTGHYRTDQAGIFY